MYYTPSTLAATNALAPELDLERVINSLIPSNYSVDFMVTSFPGYLTNLSQILSETPKAGLQAYFMWNVITTFQQWVEADVIQLIGNFSLDTSGQVSASNMQNETCRRYSGRRFDSYLHVVS